MKINHISYSLSGEHINQLKQALDLLPIPRIVDISNTLMNARKYINPFSEHSSLSNTQGRVVLVSDFPMTGKSCLAFNLAKNWLDSSIAFANINFSVVILKPEWQRNYKYKDLKDEIESCLTPTNDRINTLVIIDNLENIGITQSNADELFSWLLESSHLYHKLLIHNEGNINKLFMQSLINDSLIFKNHDAMPDVFFQRMSYDQEDITKLVHLKKCLETGYFDINNLNLTKTQSPNILEKISLQRNDNNSESYLVGLISQLSDSLPNVNHLQKELWQDAILKSLQDDYQVKIFISIIIQLHRQLKQYHLTKYSYELVGKLYIEVAKVGWPQYDQIVSVLSKANLILITGDDVFIPDLIFNILISSSMFDDVYSLDDNYSDIELLSCTANLQLGIIHLDKKDYANALHFFSKCTNAITKNQAIEYLAQHIWNQSQQRNKAPLLQEILSFIMQYLCIVFANILPQDKYKRYEDAVGRLKQIIDEQNYKISNPDELYLLIHQLASNVVDVKKFGDNDTKIAERNKLTYTLDKLTKEYLQISFYDLCNLTIPSALPELLNNLDYFNHSDETGLFKMSLDQLTLKLCEFLQESENVLSSFDYLVDFTKFGNHATAILYSYSLNELYIADPAETADIEKPCPSSFVQKFNMFEIIGYLIFDRFQYSQEQKNNIINNIVKTHFFDTEWTVSALVKQPVWAQSIEAVLMILDSDSLNNDQKKEWIDAIIYNIDPYEERANCSNALVITFSLDLVFSTQTKDTNIDVYLGYINGFFKSRASTIFQLYSAIVTRFLFEDKNYFVFKLLEHNVLKLGVKLGFSKSYQIGLASYILWLKQVCLKSSTLQAHTQLIKVHIERIHESMEEYSYAFYVCDKLYWGQNYRNLIQEQEHTLPKIELDIWQEYVSASYVFTLRIHSANNLWNDISSLKEEGYTFCEIHGVENNDNSLLMNYMVYQYPEESAIIQNPERSEFYGIETLIWGEVINYIQAGRFADSIIYLNRNQQQFQTEFEFWYLLGLGYLKLYDDLSAMVCFERSLQFAPRYINTFLKIAHIHNKLEHTKPEIELLSKAYLIDCNHFDVVYNLAKAHQLQGDVKEAITYYEHAIKLVNELSLDYQMVAEELVALYRSESYWQKALDLCWVAIKHSKEKHQWLLVLQDVLEERLTFGPVLMYIGPIYYEATVKHLILCLKEFGLSNSLVSKIATAYFKMNSNGDAWEAIREGSFDVDALRKIMVDAQAKDDVIFYTGVIHYQNNRYEAAIAEWARLLDKNHNDYEVQYYFSLANFAATQINSKLNLSKSLINNHLDIAIKSAFSSQYLGQSRIKEWELLGNIYLSLGKENLSFYSYSYYSLEEICFEAPNLTLVVAMAKVKLDQLIGNFSGGNAQETQTWLSDVKIQVVDWLQKYNKLSEKLYSPHYLNHHLGEICLKICQTVRHNSREEDYLSIDLINYFQIAHKALSSITEAKNAKFAGTYKLSGDLHWEWHFSIGPIDEKVAELQTAIQHWEKSQELHHNIKVTRLDRTIREELEILIGNARKKIKKISIESV
jgi:hypothetical protein